jgi:hypothetical protein
MIIPNQEKSFNSSVSDKILIHNFTHTGAELTHRPDPEQQPARLQRDVLDGEHLQHQPGHRRPAGPQEQPRPAVGLECDQLDPDPCAKTGRMGG